MAAPTYTHKTPPTAGANEGEQNNLGSQVIDANRLAVQGLASGLITTDVSASPITSPQTATGTATVITIPPSAIRMLVSNTDATNNLNISELSSVTTYYAIPKGVTLSLDVGRMGLLYVKSSSSSTTWSFAFQLVD
jgi:hypothetical protein